VGPADKTEKGKPALLISTPPANLN